MSNDQSGAGPEAMEDLLRDIAIPVFEQSFHFQVSVAAAEDVYVPEELQVAATIGITGSVTAALYFYTGVRFAWELTGKLLGMPVERIERTEMVKDVIGEFLRMFAEAFKAKLVERGQLCDLTMPTVFQGKDFRIEPLAGMRRHSLHLKCNESHVLLELQVKRSS